MKICCDTDSLLSNAEIEPEEAAAVQHLLRKHDERGKLIAEYERLQPIETMKRLWASTPRPISWAGGKSV